MESFTIQENSMREVVEIENNEMQDYWRKILSQIFAPNYFVGAWIAFVVLSYQTRDIVNNRLLVTFVIAATSFSSIFFLFISTFVYLIEHVQNPWHILVVIPAWFLSICYGGIQGCSHYNLNLTINQSKNRMYLEMVRQMCIFGLLMVIARHHISEFEPFQIIIATILSFIISFIFWRSSR